MTIPISCIRTSHCPDCPSARKTRLFYIYRSQTRKSKTLWYFLICIFFLTLFLALMSLPGTLIKDRLKMQSTFLLARMVGFASLIYLTLATCEIFGWQKIKKIYPPLIILFGILPLIFALFTMTPAKIKIIAGKNFIYYLTSENPMILDLTLF